MSVSPYVDRKGSRVNLSDREQTELGTQIAGAYARLWCLLLDGQPIRVITSDEYDEGQG